MKHFLRNRCKFIKRQIKQEQKHTLFSINNEIKLSIQLLRYKATKNNVKIVFIKEASIKMFGDSLKFHHLVTNFISNAIDSYDKSYNGIKKKIEIHVKSFKTFTRLIIQDWGCGISKKNIHKIFNPLFTTKDFNNGFGIGLYTSKEVVEKDFNGKIKVKSQKNKGTTFFIDFPIKQRKKSL